MQTIERNYVKHPHTARFLMAYHAAGEGLGLPAEVDENGRPVEDLLDTVPVSAPAYRPTERQFRFMADLTREIREMHRPTAQQAAEYTDQMGANNAWTPENTSRWIDRLIAKRAELRAAAVTTATVTSWPTTAQVADGRYAVEEDGVLRFFKVTNGRKPGFVFLDIQASDDWHSIRNLGRIRAVLALIAVDAEEASLRYGQELGICGDCGRTLTDETSRARGRGPVCDARH